MSLSASRSPVGPAVVAVLLPMVAVVFIAFLVIGLAMPVPPIHVHRGLGRGTFAVGLVAGAQFAAALLSRFWAGHQADSRGAKRATVAGLLLAAAGGVLYLLSLRLTASPEASVAILIIGRGVLGGAESFIVMGSFGWGLRGPGRRTRAWSCPGSERRCTSPTRPARRPVPPCTPATASSPSLSRRRSSRSSRWRSSPDFRRWRRRPMPLRASRP